MSFWIYLGAFFVFGGVAVCRFGRCAYSRDIDTGEEVGETHDGIFAAQLHRAVLKELQ